MAKGGGVAIEKYLISLWKQRIRMKTILVTGAAGFIGANLVLRLLDGESPLHIVGLDNMNDYYDPALKEYRLRLIEKKAAALSAARAAGQAGERVAATGGEAGQAGTAAGAGGAAGQAGEIVAATGCVAGLAGAAAGEAGTGSEWVFVRGSIADRGLVERLFGEYRFDVVVNLAAQAEVMYAIENPDVYIESNIIGFYNILEACRHSGENGADGYKGVQHLVYASSSSVYGGNKKVPFSVEDRVDNPVSLYAATKKSNELMAYCYSKLYGIPSTGLRFFTVYGPAGRPDMAYFGFTDKLLAGKNIRIFNYGNCRRDFTYIDDIVEGIVRVMGRAPSGTTEGGAAGNQGAADNAGAAGAAAPAPADSPVPYAVYNIGGGRPENLLEFVKILQEELVRAGVLPEDYDFDAHKELVPMQPGDVPVTYADSSALERDFGFTPQIPLREGLRRFAEWYKSYYC